MESIVQACKGGKNAMLESPTGTGKTLSLLCSSLGWLHGERKKAPETNYPRIIYTSRTHSQLTQVIKELKKTVYRPVISTLGSRDMLCINPNANIYKGTQLNITCKKFRKNNMCPYAFGKANKHPELKTKILDIEDLQKFGIKTQVCPFYASRELVPYADLIFMPYNYLLDSKIRAQCSAIQYTNSVIIFDEAHNVQKLSEEASSFEVSVSVLKKCIDEIKQIQKIKQSIMLNEDLYEDLRTEMEELSEEDIEMLEQSIENFIEYLCNVQNVGPEGVVYEGKKLFDIFLAGTKPQPSSKDDTESTSSLNPELEDVGIDGENWYKYLAIAKKCVDVLSMRNTGLHIDLWARTIETVYTYMSQERLKEKSKIEDKYTPNIEDFKVVICDDINDDEPLGGKKRMFKTSSEMQRKKVDARSLKAFCFNPGLAFLELLKANPRSIILTSGTLSPMESLERELRISFPIKLESTHVIAEDQAFIQVVTRDQQGSLFNFNYQNRGNIKQKKNLGKLVQDICCTSPGGVLVFFSGYAMLAQCWEMWADDIIPTIKKKANKYVYREDKTSVQNQKTLERFKKSIDNGEGAVLFAVCRGKISEGIDFSDNAARTVIVIGVPFPSMTDKKVTLKREYLDRRNQALQINGKTWYIQEAIKAVNQSIGRVIRHINDYGGIVLVDQRYSNDWLKRHLSKWLRDHIKVTDRCEECIELLENFFNVMEKKRFPNRMAQWAQESDTKKVKKAASYAETQPNLVEEKTTKRVTNETPCTQQSAATTKQKRKRKHATKQRADTKFQPQTKLQLAEVKKEEQKTEIKPKEEATKTQWIKEMYNLISKTLGKSKLKKLINTFQEYRGKKENKDLGKLAVEIYEMFYGENKEDDALVEQTNDALKKTAFFIEKAERSQYEKYLIELMAAKKDCQLMGYSFIFTQMQLCAVCDMINELVWPQQQLLLV
eukprot:TRINITY_DN1003_c0_g1_i10.p1 TRINITY_DN1003_c0_g1~~TRINITY_DN1003_c0_g1_i10.p1  ORF type:complete len:945 (+),score=123.31 TRINITY_DN1003_c0_g1_i10:294-3128(+)